MNRFLFLASLVACGTVGLSAPATAAICFEPRAPSSLFLRKPIKPYCASSGSCDEWEVSSYKDEVRRYYQALEDYAVAVDKFHKKAAEYIDCMADLD